MNVNLGMADHLSEVEMVNDTISFIGGQNGTILKTEDAGANWSLQVNLNPTNTGGNNDWVEGIYFSDISNGYALLQSSEVFKTIDGGATWFSSYYTSSNLSYGEAMDAADSRIIFVRYDQVIYTDNQGVMWDSTSLPIIGAYDIDMVSGGIGYVCGQGGALAITTDYGDSWTQVSTGYSYDFQAVEVISSSKLILVADGGHVIMTTDGGSTFFEINLGTSDDLRNVEFANTNDGIIVGKNNTVYTTNSGGAAAASWQSNPSSQNVDIYGVDVLDNEKAIIVGDANSIHVSPPIYDINLISYNGPDTVCTGVPFDFSLFFENLGPGDAENVEFVILANFSSLMPTGNQVYQGTVGVGGSATLNVPNAILNSPGIYNLDILALDDIDQVNSYIGTVTITVIDPDPHSVSASQEFCPGDTVTLEASGGLSYFWLVNVDNPFLSQIEVSPTNTQLYAVSIEQAFCTFLDTAYVVLAGDCDTTIIDTTITDVTPLESYAFSPNGDGVNDTFVLDFLDGTNNTVTIYNRWGDQLHNFVNYNNEDVVWNGNYLGVTVPFGTYYFVVNYSGGSSVAGWVQVVR